MITLGGKLFSSLVESIWARPDPDPNVMDIDPAITKEKETTTNPGAVPKRKLAQDAYVEVEKRRCGYFSRIIRPMRIMKPAMPSFFLHGQIPNLLYLKALKAKGKRICPSIFKIPVDKRPWHAGTYWRPSRKLRIPLLLRRSLDIFPRPEGKRSRSDASEHAHTKKVHKELDNQALSLHFRYYNWDYQPAPRNRLQRVGSHNPFRPQTTMKRDARRSHFRPALSFLQYTSRPSSPGMDIDETTPTSIPLRELETLSLDGDSDSSMEGLEIFSHSSRKSFSSVSSWSQISLDPETPEEKPNKGPLQFFLRQLENLRSRPLFPSVRQSYSAWGPLSI